MSADAPRTDEARRDEQLSRPGRVARPVSNGRPGRALLTDYARKRWVPLLIVGAVVVAGTLSAIAGQYALKLLIDGMSRSARFPGSLPGHGNFPGALHDPVYIDLAALLVFLALEQVFGRVSGWLGSRAVIALGAELRAELFARVLRQPWRFFHDRKSGTLAARIGAASAASTQTLATLVWNVVPPAADLVGSATILAVIDVRLTMVLVLGAVILSALLRRAGERGFEIHRAHHEAAAANSGEIADVLSHVMLVKLFGAAGRERLRLRQRLQHEAGLHGRSWMFLERLRMAHDLSLWILAALLLFAAVHEWRAGALTTGDVVVVVTLSLRVLHGSRELALSLLGLSHQLSTLHEAAEALAPKDYDAVGRARGPGAGSAGELPAIVRGTPRMETADVAFDRVWFAPDGNRTLFRDFSLHIPAGQRLGIVGASGAGKSTLLRLLQGLSRPDRGAVTIDGRSVSALLEAEGPRFCAAVTQEVELLHRSIGENLCYGQEDIEIGELDRAVGDADCAGFVAALPDGYATLVGERGVMLSGGQRQRLALARALLMRTPVLLLDEATASLDSASERSVQRALLGRMAGRTVIAVAHRLSTLMEFDRIVVLDAGRIVEDGPPAMLLEAGGVFAGLWRMQGGRALTHVES